MEAIKSKDEIIKLLSRINEDIDLAKIEQMIIDNKIEFEHKDKKYRVRLLTLREKEELELLRLKKYNQLLQDKDILFEVDLIKVYKNRGINIDEIDEEVKKIDAEALSLRLDLGKALENKEPETILNTYKDKLYALLVKKEIYSYQKTDLLKTSLENYLLNYVAEVITYLTLEFLEQTTWTKVFNAYEDFIKCEDEELLNKAGMRSMLLQYI